MVTSPTRESVTTGEVKASGSCQFILTLSEEANFFVAVSPGDRNYSVKFPAHDKKIDETKVRCLQRAGHVTSVPRRGIIPGCQRFFDMMARNDQVSKHKSRTKRWYPTL
ncbi:hypothetical protein C0Q70_12311 [Pomacea canaliculata]|uniref:Uncharacterized protein n=1 Tax=Pomacea canaliculata TaxID=400727 RepID=A0A2T7P156_POMCA|nr:hypothetical protein C0Q70_12311 [Pomacea canaliculata]